MRAAPMLFRVLLAVCVLIVSASCARFRESRKAAKNELVVKRIRFEGNTRFRAKELREYMQTEPSSWRRRIGLAEAQALLKGRLRDDLQTLIRLYRSVGYYDAKIVDTRVEKKRDKSNLVTLVVVISEGEPIRVTKRTVVFDAEIPEARDVEGRLALKKGGVADMQLLTDSREAAIAALHDAGYALCEVKESMEVDLESRAASARFEISPGPRCRVGTIHVTGLDAVPFRLVKRELSEFKGAVYTPALKKKMEDVLLSMNVFSLVSVYHDTTLNEDGRLDVQVSLSEGNPQSLKLGIGIELEPDVHKARLALTYSHRNLFHRLVGFQLKAQAGYAFVPAFWQVDSHGPVALLEPTFSKKGLLEKELYWSIGTAFRADVEEDFKYITPGARLSVSRIFFEKMLASLSYNFNLFYIYDATDRWVNAIHDAYPAFVNPDRVGYVEARYKVSLTDRLVDPHNGAVFEIRYALAAESLGSMAQYHKVSPSVSFYWQMIPRLQLAVRAVVGMLLPYGDTTDTSYWSNYFLGGYNTIRGWGGKKLAPSVEYCVAENDCDTLRIGGRTSVLGNLELRVRTVEGLFIATFLDVGDVQYGVMTFAPSAWNYTVGAGLRFDSPVGKVRFDVGFRVNDPEIYREEPRWGIHIGLGEAF